MNRRSILKSVLALPFLGFLKREGPEAEPQAVDHDEFLRIWREKNEALRVAMTEVPPMHHEEDAVVYLFGAPLRADPNLPPGALYGFNLADWTQP